MNEIHILIGMPIYRSTLYIQTLSSLMSLKDELYTRDIKSSFVYIDSFDIVSARNMIATYFFRSSDFSHLLFIDDDMEFQADDILQLLMAQKPLTGCLCPKRKLSPEAIYNAALEGKSLSGAMAVGLDFVVNHNRAGQLVVENNFCRLKSIGMAVTLIERTVFDQMQSQNVAEKRALPEGLSEDSFGNPYHYGFFDRMLNDAQDSYLGEDFSFCRRWTEDCGGEIFGLVTAKIGHVGSFVFEGRYIDSLQAGKL